MGVWQTALLRTLRVQSAHCVNLVRTKQTAATLLVIANLQFTRCGGQNRWPPLVNVLQTLPRLWQISAPLLLTLLRIFLGFKLWSMCLRAARGTCRHLGLMCQSPNLTCITDSAVPASQSRVEVTGRCCPETRATPVILRWAARGFAVCVAGTSNFIVVLRRRRDREIVQRASGSPISGRIGFYR